RGEYPFEELVERAAKLICTTPEFDDLARETGLAGHEDGVTDPDERARLRAEIDGIVAHLYGLTEEEFAHVLSTFPLVPQPTKDAAMSTYRAQAPKLGDPEIARLIAQGEGDQLEFKIAAIWNPFKQCKDGTMRENVVQAVASFMNSSDGGTVLIGVRNGDGVVIGLADDYYAANPQRPGRDSYELFLRSLLGDSCGADCTLFYDISFHQVDGQDLCRISVRPAPKPVYLRGELYIRNGNQKRKLTPHEAFEYRMQRWGV
ncbi:MAG: ATP-binding protein, partial [Chloroflexota bacterium]|nr:ATP-binding protein [Chloroflexota bacterium]